MKFNRYAVELLMMQKGLTRKALAERVGMKPQNLSSAILRGSAHESTVTRIANGLGVSVDTLLKDIQL